MGRVWDTAVSRWARGYDWMGLDSVKLPVAHSKKKPKKEGAGVQERANMLT